LIDSEKESHPVISQASIAKNNERKIKSLSKYEVKKLSESHKKRSALASEPELATIEGLLNRNMQMVKFSMSKERERIMTKQKYKRSEQVRSLLDNKKMSSMGKNERRDTENSNRVIQANRFNDSEGSNHRGEFK
jgi:ethanolamine utilization protein EutQ (cupin superfamily)